MKTIYLVQFITGKYEDKQKIIVYSFSKESSAKQYTFDFNTALKAAGAHRDQDASYNGNPFSFQGKDFYINSTGAEISYYPIQLDPIL